MKTTITTTEKKPAILPPATSDAVRFAELDGKINQSLANVKTAAANFADGELPPGFIDLAGFGQFIKSKGITLTEDDETGLLIIFSYFDAGAVLSPDTVIKFLREFNPARALELAA